MTAAALAAAFALFAPLQAPNVPGAQADAAPAALPAVALSEADEARARALMREIRCVACAGEPISQSGAGIALDMQERVRQLVAYGNTDAEIRAQFAALYGEQVLFRPQVRGAADYALWGAPLLLLLLGGAAIWAGRKGAGPGAGAAVAAAIEPEPAAPPSDADAPSPPREAT